VRRPPLESVLGALLIDRRVQPGNQPTRIGAELARRAGDRGIGKLLVEPLGVEERQVARCLADRLNVRVVETAAAKLAVRVLQAVIEIQSDRDLVGGGGLGAVQLDGELADTKVGGFGRSPVNARCSNMSSSITTSADSRAPKIPAVDNPAWNGGVVPSQILPIASMSGS
jgi:hypothetical protein